MAGITPFSPKRENSKYGNTKVYCQFFQETSYKPLSKNQVPVGVN
jgi:hypothetical protein